MGHPTLPDSETYLQPRSLGNLILPQLYKGVPAKDSELEIC